MSAPYDILIPAAPKDRNKLKYLIPSIERNISGFSNIYITVPDKNLFSGYIPDSRYPIHLLNDREILDIDTSRFPYRPNWIYQQYLKMFQNVTQNDLFLTVDSDVIINRRMPMFETDGRRIFWMGWEQDHRPYFEFQEKVFDLPRVYPHTFINDMNFMDKLIIRELLDRYGFTVESFIEKSIEIITKDCFPGEPEIYGQYVHKFHPGLYSFRETNSVSIGRFASSFEDIVWTDSDIQSEIASKAMTDYHLFTLHTWFNMKGAKDP